MDLKACRDCGYVSPYVTRCPQCGSRPRSWIARIGTTVGLLVFFGLVLLYSAR